MSARLLVMARSLRRGNPDGACAASMGARLASAAGLPRFARNDAGRAHPGARVTLNDQRGEHKLSVIARSLRRGNPDGACAASMGARLASAAGLPRFARNDGGSGARNDAGDARNDVSWAHHDAGRAHPGARVTLNDERGEHKLSVIARSLRRGNPDGACAASMCARSVSAAGLPRFARNDESGEHKLSVIARSLRRGNPVDDPQKHPKTGENVVC